MVNILGKNKEHRYKEQLEEAFGYHLQNDSPLGNCLIYLLTKFKVHENLRKISDSLPHLKEKLELNDIKKMMFNLNYKQETDIVKIGMINPQKLPCLFISENNQNYVISKIDKNGVVVFDGETKNITSVKDLNTLGNFYYFKPNRSEAKLEQDKKIKDFIKDKKGILLFLFGINYIINMSYLLVPVYIKSIYGTVLPTSSLTTLLNLTLSVLIAFILVYKLNDVRIKIICDLGEFFDANIANNICSKILFLKPLQVENLTINTKISKMSDFEFVRDLIYSPLFNVILDLPFIITVLFIIYFIGGSLVYIPISIILVYILLGFLAYYMQNYLILNLAKYISKTQKFLIESINNINNIKILSMRRIWEERFDKISADSSIANFNSSAAISITSAISDMLTVLSGILIISYGAFHVIDNKIGIGILIVCMILIWRILAPLKVALGSMFKIIQINQSNKGYDSLMALPSEIDNYEPLIKDIQDKHCEMTLKRLGFRYNNKLNPVLIGLDFTVNIGEIVVVAGENGCGKTTLLKLLLGFYEPSFGRILINNIDVTQVNPIQLRRFISYVPQNAHVFYGTISQAIKLAKPMASHEEVEHAAYLAGILDIINRLPNKFDTPISGIQNYNVSSSFIRGITIARAYIKKSPIMIMDEPGNLLDKKGNDILEKTLIELKKTTAIIIATHDKRHLKIADKVVRLIDGQAKLMVRSKKT